MKRVFYYAELDLTVSLVDGKMDILQSFSENDVQALSLMLHSTVTDFLLLRAVYIKETIESLERIHQAGQQHVPDKNGGKDADSI